MSEAALVQPPLSGHALRDAWSGLTERSAGKLRSRDAAQRLGVSEGELIASLVGDTATRLRTEGAAIIKDVMALGSVMALTRNEHCVHEKIGPYLDVTINPAHGLVLGELIDLRIFPSRWHHTFAVIDETDAGPRRSIQVFDADGTAVHKIYQKPATNIEAFDALIKSWRADDQSDVLSVRAIAPQKGDRADTEIDVEKLRREWAALEDTHDFFGMLRGLEVGRLQALRLAGSTFARAVPLDSLARAMQAACDNATPIMVFVGNAGCIQIHSGPVTNLKKMGPWFNVLDSTFNLHLREDAIASAWIVRKPTRDGDVTSLELFDRDGFCFAQMFGVRKPGKPELEAWRTIASEHPVAMKKLGLAAVLCLLAIPAQAASPQRVVALGGDVTEIVYALGAGNRIACDDQTALYPLAATKLPQVGYLRTLAAEGVLSCKPDLIIASEDAGPPAAMTQLDGSGVRIVHVTNAHSPDAVLSKIGVIAEALGMAKQGHALQARFRSELAAVKARLAPYKDHPRAVFLMAQGPGGAMAAGRDTAADAMLTLAGAKNVAGDFPGYKPLTPEAAIALKPDVIIIADHAAKMLGGIEALRARPEIAMTPAGKSGRIYALDALLLLGFGPRTPEALTALAKALHDKAVH